MWTKRLDFAFGIRGTCSLALEENGVDKYFPRGIKSPTGILALEIYHKGFKFGHVNEQWSEFALWQRQIRYAANIEILLGLS